MKNSKRMIGKLLLVVVMFSLTIALSSFTLIKTGDRPKICKLSKSLKTQVEQETMGMNVEQRPLRNDYYNA